MKGTIHIFSHAAPIFGQLTEWFMVLVLKTSDSERDRGFESYTVRAVVSFHIKPDGFTVIPKQRNRVTVMK